jgi:hypothetical protein
LLAALFVTQVSIVTMSPEEKVFAGINNELIRVLEVEFTLPAGVVVVTTLYLTPTLYPIILAICNSNPLTI